MSTIEVDTITDCSGIGAPNFPFGASGLPKPHTPNAVSGATPSLDVGAYNFFNQGALTADTTVSFANVPTNAKWQYYYTNAVDTANAFTLTTAGFFGVKDTGSMSGSTPQVRGHAFSADGTRFWVTDSTLDRIVQFDLSPAFDLSTWAYNGVNYSVSSRGNAPYGLQLGNGGTAMYVVDASNETIFQYALSTPNDLSTISYVRSKAIATATLAFFKPDGLTVYFKRSGTNDIVQYTLSTAWNIGTASYANKSFDPNLGNLGHFCISPDGTTMILCDLGNATANLVQYTLSTPWDISTASADNLTYDNVDTSIYGLSFSPDGSILYASGLSDRIYGIELLDQFTLTLPVIKGTISAPALNEAVTYTFMTDDAGTNVNLIAEDKIA